MLELTSSAMRSNMVRTAYQTGVRVKGFVFQSVTGEIQQNLPLSGLAGEFLGIGIVNSPATALVSLSINNDVVLDRVPIQALEIDAASGNPRAFYELPRPLNGTDTITLSVVDTAPHSIKVAVWYRGRKLD